MVFLNSYNSSLFLSASGVRSGPDLKVGIVEAIDDVPAQLQELLPLQQDAMEEAQREEQLPVEDGL